MRLGIDMDGVCCNGVRGAKEMLNERFNLDLNVHSESKTWDEIEDLTTKNQWQWLWTAGVDRGLFARLQAFPGTEEALYHLSNKHDITLITHRPKRAACDTMEWVVRELPRINFKGIVLTEEKWEVPCDIYLDDKPENVQSVLLERPAGLAVIRTRPYNNDFQWPWRVDGWEQFVKFVEEREDL